MAGIDLSDQAVKFAELNQRGASREFSLRAIGKRDLPAGILSAGEIKDSQALAIKLSEIKNEFGFEEVSVALPEEKAYFVKLRLPFMQKNQLRDSIELQLEEHVPVHPKELFFDYEILKEPASDKDWYEVGVSSLPKVVVTTYLEVFKKSGLRPVAFEIESQSIGRAVVPKGDPRAYMILDLGKMRTGFTIVSDEIVWFNATIAFGGDIITSAIEKSLNISHMEADELKITVGFSPDPANKELFNALVPPLASLKDELKRHYFFWQSHKEEDGYERKKIEKILLTGGQAGMPGLKEHLAMDLMVPVETANPWTNIFSFENVIPNVVEEEALTYAIALGLALRDND